MLYGLNLLRHTLKEPSKNCNAFSEGLANDSEWQNAYFSKKYPMFICYEKECVAVLTTLYKKNGAVSCVGSGFLSDWPLTNSHFVGTLFLSAVKKCIISFHWFLTPFKLQLICTRIHCTHFVFMTLANVPSLQMWSELGAVSLCGDKARIRDCYTEFTNSMHHGV